MCVFDENSLPRSESNSLTTCWGGRAGRYIPQGMVTQTQWSHGFLMCVPESEWMTEGESLHFMVILDFISNVHKSFPFHLCAGSSPKAIIHSSVVATDTSRAAVQTSLPPSDHTVHYRGETLCCLTIPLLLDRNRLLEITECETTVLFPVCPRHNRSGVNPLLSKIIAFFPLFIPHLYTHKGTDLKCVHLKANIWSTSRSTLYFVFFFNTYPQALLL